ncbi:hypothetical protein FOL47_001555 [Perkinsus chesapeaki]|uniref:Uncharacterized protein n=1 Tax=Perkinsus chesapeaki TaxID=330153 RepID=A0A7J6MI95_PERCH|nr:hypothetical protein FOL47_001555 [Perkinsus chesapeaki]
MPGQSQRGLRAELLAIMKDIQDLVSTDFSSPSLSCQQKLLDCMAQVGQQRITELRKQTSFYRSKLQTVSRVASLHIPCNLPRRPRCQRVLKDTSGLQPRQTDLETIKRAARGDDSTTISTGVMSWEAIAVRCKSLSRVIEDVVAFDAPTDASEPCLVKH